MHAVVPPVHCPPEQVCPAAQAPQEPAPHELGPQLRPAHEHVVPPPVQTPLEHV